MKFHQKLAILLIFSILLTACGSAATPTRESMDIVLTEGVQTLVASYFGTLTAVAPAATATLPVISTPMIPFTPLAPLPTTPTLPATPTYIYFTYTPVTVTPTGTYSTATLNPNSLAYGCNNLAFIADVNYPSGTTVNPKENFTKKWKVQNTGTCNWLYGYRLAFISGTNFDAPDKSLGKVVTVNDWAEISINLDAPKKSGTYSAYWRLTDGAGHMFGSTLEVTVTVKTAAP